MGLYIYFQVSKIMRFMYLVWLLNNDDKTYYFSTQNCNSSTKANVAWIIGSSDKYTTMAETEMMIM